MANESRQGVAGLRKLCQEEIESMICLMKIEGGTLDDCAAELQLLADFVRSQAEGIREAWRDPLKGTIHEIHERCLDFDEVWNQSRKREP